MLFGAGEPHPGHGLLDDRGAGLSREGLAAHSDLNHGRRPWNDRPQLACHDPRDHAGAGRRTRVGLENHRDRDQHRVHHRVHFAPLGLRHVRTFDDHLGVARHQLVRLAVHCPLLLGAPREQLQLPMAACPPHYAAFQAQPVLAGREDHDLRAVEQPVGSVHLVLPHSCWHHNLCICGVLHRKTQLPKLQHGQRPGFGRI
mmetsp:Transcript_121017/g.314285  ORF Transcript_121017/g.314285 Transcript_121017/m.314285 type:complete len:200 (-) Transcript_121017:295-894(-)